MSSLFLEATKNMTSVTEVIMTSVHEHGLGFKYMRHANMVKHLESSRGLRGSRWSSMYERSSVPKLILQDYGSKECSGRLCNAS